DRPECSANDDADREVNDIAAQSKFLEFFQHVSLLGAAQFTRRLSVNNSMGACKSTGGSNVKHQVGRGTIKPLGAAAKPHVKASVSSDFTCSSRIRLSNKVSRSSVDALPVMRLNLSRSCSVESGVSGQPSQLSIWPPNVRPSLSAISR